MRIMAEQLERLGIEPTPEDLERHLLLAYDYAEDLEVDVDGAYLEWSDGWLRRLREANASTARYERRAFDRVLGDVRMLLAARAYRTIGWSAFRGYVFSTLPLGLGSSQTRARAAPGVRLRPAARARGGTAAVLRCRCARIDGGPDRRAPHTASRSPRRRPRNRALASSRPVSPPEGCGARCSSHLPVGIVVP